MTYSSSSIVPLSASFNRVTCGGSLKFYKAKSAEDAASATAAACVKAVVSAK